MLVTASSSFLTDGAWLVASMPSGLSAAAMTEMIATWLELQFP